MTMPTITETIEFIELAFDGKKDAQKFDYFHHPITVMHNLPEGTSEEVKLAALLHDIIDDTIFTRGDLEKLGYSKNTLDIVQLLSKDFPGEKLNDKEYFERIKRIIASGNEGAILVKFADMRTNTDPERLAQLNESKRKKFEKKYAKPLALLTAEVKRWGYPIKPRQEMIVLPSDRTESEPLNPILQQRQRAQDTLVDLTIQAALKDVYWDTAYHDRKIRSEITIHNYIGQNHNRYASHEIHIPLFYGKEASPCTTSDEAWATISRLFDNEFDRVQAFNAFAAVNHVDLQLKTSGHKSSKSIYAKARRRYDGDLTQIKDIARIKIVASNPAKLNDIAAEVMRQIDQGGSKSEGILEPWEMHQMGVLKRTICARIHGVPAEVQFVPREQEQIAGRINHKFYEIVRSYDACFDNSDPGLRQKQMTNTTASYNQAAAIINRLFDADPKEIKSEAIQWKQANKALTDITVPEIGAPLSLYQASDSPFQQETVVPIFKSGEDLESYRRCLREGNKLLSSAIKQVVLPLPILPTKDVDEVKLGKVLVRLNNVRKMTTAYYMQQATPEMRELWRDEACALNDDIPDRHAKPIPEDFIKSVCQGRGGTPPIDYQPPHLRQKARGVHAI